MGQNQIEAARQSFRGDFETTRIHNGLAASLCLRPPDRTEALSDLDDDPQATRLPRPNILTTAGLFEDLQVKEPAEVAGSLSNQALTDVLDKLKPDGAADVLGDLSPGRRAQPPADIQDTEGMPLGAVASGRVLRGGIPTQMTMRVSATISATCLRANAVDCLVAVVAHADGIVPEVTSAPRSRRRRAPPGG